MKKNIYKDKDFSAFMAFCKLIWEKIVKRLRMEAMHKSLSYLKMKPNTNTGPQGQHHLLWNRLLQALFLTGPNWWWVMSLSQTDITWYYQLKMEKLHNRWLVLFQYFDASVLLQFKWKTELGVGYFHDNLKVTDRGGT